MCRNSFTYRLLLLALVSFGYQQIVSAWWMQAEPPKPLQAKAEFDMDGVKGEVLFTQTTLVEYKIKGLRGENKLYHVHLNPVPVFDPSRVGNNASAIAQLCGEAATGGHLNPYQVTTKLPPQSAPHDKYELGDLSGKHGPLKIDFGRQREDIYEGSFTDNYLPMLGANSIVGRSIVIHKNSGHRWVCASIKPVV